MRKNHFQGQLTSAHNQTHSNTTQTVPLSHFSHLSQIDMSLHEVA